MTEAANITNELPDGVDSVIAELTGIQLVGTHRFLATQCFRFGQWESPRVPGSRRLGAPFILHANCPWTIRTRDAVLVSSGDPVPAAEEDVAVEERLEWEQLRSDSNRNRDLKAETALSLDDDGDIKPEKQSEFIVLAVAFDISGEIKFEFSNGHSLLLTIVDLIDDSWFLYCPDRRIFSYYKGQMCL